MLDLDPDQVEKDFAKNAILQVEFALIEFELDVQALLYSYLHLDRPISVRFHANIGHDKFFFFRYAIVISVYDHVDIVPQPYHNSIVSLELLFNSIELEVVGNVVCECTRGF